MCMGSKWVEVRLHKQIVDVFIPRPPEAKCLSASTFMMLHVVVSEEFSSTASLNIFIDVDVNRFPPSCFYADFQFVIEKPGI